MVLVGAGQRAEGRDRGGRGEGQRKEEIGAGTE